MKRNQKNRARAGFSLLEVVVAVLIFSLFIAAFGVGVANSIQANGNAERRMRAELDVSNAVEQLMSEGYHVGDTFPGVEIINLIEDYHDGVLVGYKLTIKPKTTDAWTENIKVTTYVRKS